MPRFSFALSKHQFPILAVYYSPVHCADVRSWILKQHFLLGLEDLRTTRTKLLVHGSLRLERGIHGIGLGTRLSSLILNQRMLLNARQDHLLACTFFLGRSHFRIWNIFKFLSPPLHVICALFWRLWHRTTWLDTFGCVLKLCVLDRAGLVDRSPD